MELQPGFQFSIVKFTMSGDLCPELLLQWAEASPTPKIGNPPGQMVAWRKSRWKREDTERARNDDVGQKECDLMPGLGLGRITWSAETGPGVMTAPEYAFSIGLTIQCQ